MEVKTKQKKEQKIQPHKNFVLLEKYRLLFPIDDTTAFPYNHIIYTNSPELITPEIVLHEEVHFKQQDEIGLDNWVEMYFTDVNFRTKVELEAYKAQVSYFTNKDIKDMIRVQCAKALSSPMYGNILTYKEAYAQLGNSTY
jgi:hypothetical protein